MFEFAKIMGHIWYEAVFFMRDNRTSDDQTNSPDYYEMLASAYGDHFQRN